MAIVGRETFDVSEVDIDSLVLTRADGVGGEVTPLTQPWGLRPTIQDVATPFAGDFCDCHKLHHDGIDDLLLRFSVSEMARSLELHAAEDVGFLLLTLHGSLLDGSGFSASDCVLTLHPHGSSNDVKRGHR
jgi:hypothetical protein